jgi:hypothetical protein
MAKQLISIRIDNVTEGQIEDLERWDNTTQTAIISRAVANYWRERKSQMKTTLELTISKMDWDMIENDGDTVIKYNHDASEDKYCQAVADKLAKMFDGVTASVAIGDRDYMDGYNARWDPYEGEPREADTYISNAIDDVYGNWDWVVPAAGVLSIDNGRSECTPEEAIAAVAWDVIVNAMDDDIRETVHMDVAPCSELEFLRAYLKLGSVVIG